MRIFLLVAPLISLLLSSCLSMSSNNEDPPIFTYEYVDVQDQIIRWDDIFNKNNTYIYIFSETCSHCNSIKETVLSYAVEHNDSFYLVRYTSVISLSTNIDFTIGATSPNEISILGTPTLLKIFENKLILNIAGSESIIDEIYQNG